MNYILTIRFILILYVYVQCKLITLLQNFNDEQLDLLYIICFLCNILVYHNIDIQVQQ